MSKLPVSFYDNLLALSSSNDSVSYRPIIVWAMNDSLNKHKLKQELLDFKESGYGGVMVMPWGGLPYDFMCDEWLSFVRFILENAKELSLDIWLWDDWLFGSGPAGGELTKNPEYRAKELSVAVDYIIEEGESADFVIPPRTISAATFSANKFGNSIDEELSEIEAEPGQRITINAETRTRIVIVCWRHISGMQHTTKSHAGFLDPDISEAECDIRISDDVNSWSVDMMNQEAVRKYTQLIHQRYFDAMPEFFGNTLKGFFYDEPKAAGEMPWTFNFAERFKALKGYDLTPYLPLILTDFKMENVNFNSQLRSKKLKGIDADYRDVWSSLVADTFYGTIQNWCQKHNVISSGHPIGDNSLNEAFSSGGLYLKNMDRSDMPGIDTVGGFNLLVPGIFTDSPRFAGSRAACNGKTRAMSESFAVYGHGVDLDQMRYICEHQIIRGVNTFFCKLSNYNREKSLHFHPPELSDFNPVIKHFGKDLCERIEKIAKLMNSESVIPRVALYLSASNYYHNDFSIAERVTAVAEKLTYNQIEFDYLWDQDINNIESHDNLLVTPFGQTYCSMIIPQESMMPQDIRLKLNELGSDFPLCELQEQCLEDVIASCKSQLHDSFTILFPDVKVSVRRAQLGDGMECEMFLSEAKVNEILTIEPKSEISVFELNTNSWEFELVQGVTSKSTQLRLEFTSGESRILLFNTTDTKNVTVQNSYESSEKYIIKNWTLNTPDGEKVINDIILPDWAELGFPGYCGFMRYTALFEWNSNEMEAMLSLGNLCYAATVYLDGEKIGNCLFSPFHLKLKNLTCGSHKLEIDVLNTMANTIFGDDEKLHELSIMKALKGTYAPFYQPLDMVKLRSGLLGPVELKKGE